MLTKHLLSTVVFISFLTTAYSQITLTQADVPAFGEVFANAVDTVIGPVDLGTASADAQTWSFLDFDMDEAFTNTVVMPAETPSAALFPNATFAFEGSNGLYSYAQVTPTALLAAGGSAPGPNGAIFTVAFDPGQQLLAVPSTYGTAFESDFGFELQIDGGDFGVDSVRIIEVGSVSAEIDAFGEITVPAGTFEVLRQRSVITTTDFIYAKIFGTFLLIDVIENTTINYEWWAADGVGTVCSIDFDQDGSPISATYLTAINPSDVPPAASFTAEALPEGQVQFTDNSTNMPVSWSWDFGDGNASSMQNPLHTYSASGTYTVCLTAANSAGSDVSCQEITVVAPPAAGFTLQDEGEGAFAFTDTSTNAPTGWSWDFGDGNTSTAQNPTHTYAENGIYTVCLTATNSAGSDVSCQEITVVLPPQASFTFSDEGQGMVAFADASANAPTGWSWDFGDGNTSTAQNPTHTYAENGIYTVCLTATNSAGSDVSCQEITVVLPPQASFTFSDEGQGMVAFADASANAPTGWSWDFGDGNTSTAQNPTHTYAENGTYTVCLTATNSAGSDVSCQEIEVVIVSTQSSSAVAYAEAYPSPAEDWLRISFREWQGQPVTLSAFSVNGQQLFTRSLKKAPVSFEVNVTEWPAGTYYLRLQGNGQIQTLSFTVK